MFKKFLVSSDKSFYPRHEASIANPLLAILPLYYQRIIHFMLPIHLGNCIICQQYYHLMKLNAFEIVNLEISIKSIYQSLFNDIF